MMAETYKQLIDEMKIVIEKFVSHSDFEVVVANAGIRCTDCGVELIVNIDEIDSLAEAMESHESLCPANIAQQP